jgi:hypothetical protein
LILIKKLIISTKLTIPLDSRHQTPNKWNETIPTLFSQVRIHSTGFIFVTFDYNGGFKNGKFVVKIYRCFLTAKNHRATSTSLLALVQSEVSSHKATSSPESPSNKNHLNIMKLTDSEYLHFFLLLVLRVWTIEVQIFNFEAMEKMSKCSWFVVISRLKFA